MFNTSVMLGLAIGLVCVFVALAYLVCRITSVREDTENAIEKVYDSNRETWFALAERVKKLEDSKICALETGTDEAGKTSLYAITKVGYSTIIVSLTDDELAVIESFVDWACLDDDFSVEKLDKNYKSENWRDKK